MSNYQECKLAVKHRNDGTEWQRTERKRENIINTNWSPNLFIGYPSVLAVMFIGYPTDSS